jgi:hypothetical protein
MPPRSASAIAAVAGAALLLLVARAAAAPPPNFIVVLVDDWGWGDLGANGFGAETPSMDRYAARGVLFRDMHANSVCTPTRSALQTGRSTMRMGVTGNFGVGSREGLSLDEVTVAELLQRGANYSTSATGKWCAADADAVAHCRRASFSPPLTRNPPPRPLAVSAGTSATARRTGGPAAIIPRGAAMTHSSGFHTRSTWLVL